MRLERMMTPAAAAAEAEYHEENGDQNYPAIQPEPVTHAEAARAVRESVEQRLLQWGALPQQLQRQQQVMSEGP
jgi:uncharacterized protein YbjT (DUF2867 family)